MDMDPEIEKLLHLNLHDVLIDPRLFAAAVSGLRLRAYQKAVAVAIIESVLKQKGLSFVVMFPRQSGKNEVQAQIEAFLLTIFHEKDAEMVKISPTWKPQSLNAMRRLERVLNRNLITRPNWVKESGYLYRLENARMTFLSGGPEANIVGATASTLLEVDEAQDIQIDKFDREVAPMAASTNATRVFWGTAWTSTTLLARELRACQEAQERDGQQRVFRIGADEVSKEVKSYGRFVAEQVTKLGRSHPMVRTQYFSEEIDAEAGMFPARRVAMLRGEHSRREQPRAGAIYALLLDVAGQDEGLAAGSALDNPGRDATALTVVEVDLATLGDALIQAPTYRVVSRQQWVGEAHVQLYARLKALAEHWGARHLVADATGVGAGLVAFLERALPGRVTPFVFNAATKSKLGWDFLSIVETGRFKTYAEDDEEQAAFLSQLSFCRMEVLPGPEQRMKWGVPDGTRDGATGELVHDDWVLSAALCAVLDGFSWSAGGPALVVRAEDPLKAMDEGF
jgi:hypothetical protein